VRGQSANEFFSSFVTIMKMSQRTHRSDERCGVQVMDSVELEQARK